MVPRRLGLRDARADPALVLLAVLHGRDARRPFAVRARAHLREGLRPVRQADAQVEREPDRAGRGARADGGRRGALALLRAVAEPAAPLRLRAGRRRQAAPAEVLELD